MLDVAKQAGILVETHVLQAALGVPVIPMIASSNQGVKDLVDAALNLLIYPEELSPNRPEISEEHRPVLEELCLLIDGKIENYPVEWLAVKLLEGDSEITEMVQKFVPDSWERIEELLMHHEDAYLDVAGSRYEWIGRIVRAAVVNPKPGVISITDSLDKIATHPFWGLILLLAVFGMMFWLTYAAAMPIVSWLDLEIVSTFSESVRQGLEFSPTWFSSLIVDGLISGAGSVLALLPVLVIFFAVLGLLEDTGYLARSAYVMDRFMHWIGLHGRSFLPLLIGFGCNVPGILGTRIIEEKRARLFTILLMPLVPCTGRLAVIAFLAAALFGKKAALVTWGLVAGNILLLFLIGLVVHKGVLKGIQSALIMEMPLYHIPNARTIGIYVWQNTQAFVLKAGTVILLASAIVWFFSYLPNGNIQESLLANFGRWLEPAARWLGLDDWRLIVALLSSFVAKENTIATLGVLFGSDVHLGLAEQVAQAFSPASALGFLVMQMTFIPCVATVAAMKQETGTWKWPILSTGVLLLISFSAAAIIYQIASITGWGL